MLTFEGQVLCGNTLQRFCSGLAPHLEPNREFGFVANSKGWLSNAFFEHLHSGVPISEECLRVILWGSKRPSRWVLMWLRHFILRLKYGSLTTVSLLIEYILLRWPLHHSPLRRSDRQNNIRISRTTVRWLFCDQAWYYSTSIRSWTASRPWSSPS